MAPIRRAQLDTEGLLGGRTNTIAEFRSLAREAGLEVTAAAQAPSGHFVVECRPVPTPHGPQ